MFQGQLVRKSTMNPTGIQWIHMFQATTGAVVDVWHTLCKIVRTCSKATIIQYCDAYLVMLPVVEMAVR